MKFGIQTYGAKKEWQAGPEKFFREIARMGCRLLEPCLTMDGGEEAEALGFWTASDLEDRFPAIREAGLEIPSAHVFAADPEKALPELIRLAKACGIGQYIFPCPREITEEKYLAWAETCKSCAAVLEDHGVKLLLHNGGEEIKEKLGGKTAYEYLLDACGGLVGAQPDVGWLYTGGEDPEAFLWRNENRVWSIHYKDRKDDPPEEVPVGSGCVDLLACFQFARAHGVPQIIDMDVCTLGEIGDALKLLAGMTFRRERTASVLCVLDVDSGELRPLRRFEGVIEAPNWLGDGDTILYNAEGRIFRYSINGDRIEQVDTGECDACNNDHVPAPDGKRIAVSHGFPSQVYIVENGKPTQVTSNAPSYLHGWSPDGKELAYCAFRDKERGEGYNVDIYTIPAEGGVEKRLTDGVGYNDGPEYSPDGKYIWFNSTRSGLMQAWRMDREGDGLTQMTEGEANNWFPHVSPDGRRVVYLTFRKGDLEPHEHLPNMQVSLSLMNSDGTGKKKILDFFGGQGSINVNSWAPDSRRVALVIYELEHR